MQKYQIQKLRQTQKIINEQIYLLKIPHTPQQYFLHLLGHRILIRFNMFHKNLDILLDKLQGTFANSYLKICYITKCLQNSVQFKEEKHELVVLIQRWANLYPSIRNKKAKIYLMRNLIANNPQSVNKINGFNNYLTYLNMISIDLWKIIKNKNHQKEFHIVKHIKEDLKECYKNSQQKYDAFDLLDFVYSCLPDTMANIIVEQKILPQNIKKANPMQCLYSNKTIQFYLRTSTNLAILLKHILLIILAMNLSKSHQKSLMQVAMRYFIIYHYDRKYCATQILIYSFNKVSQQIKSSLKGEFLHFFNIMFKLGKIRFINFVTNNSSFVKSIVQNCRQGLVGYRQKSVNPYNPAKISDTIQINKGSRAVRYFEILQDYSILYFRISVLSLDISVNLYYLGSFTAQKQQRSLLAKYQRVSGQIKQSINVDKKGLYMLEFDNSYSWLNKKTILYENQILTPLQLKEIEQQQWIQQFYEIELNKISDIKSITYLDPIIEANNIKQTFNTIYKKDGFLVLEINQKNKHYVYETDNVQLMKAKAKHFYYSQQGCEWRIQSNVSLNIKGVRSFAQIQSFIQSTQLIKNQAQSIIPQKQKRELPQFESSGQEDQDQ